MKIPIVIRINPIINESGLTNEINSVVKPLHINNPIIVIEKNVRKIPDTKIITHCKIIHREVLFESPLEVGISLFMIRKIVKGIIGKRHGDKAT
jgi:hypothetical protein